MSRFLAIAAPILLTFLPALSGCDSGTGTLVGPDGGTSPTFEIDTSDLGEGEVLVDYQGRLALSGTAPSTVWTHSDGEMPPGLSLAVTGFVTGTPGWLGTFAFEVTATPAGQAPVVGEVSISILAGDADLALGFEHDQMTSLTSGWGLMTDPWVRIAGTGIDGMSTYTLLLGVYDSGPNGAHEQGLGDDIRVGDLPLSDATVTIDKFDPTGPIDPNGSSYPSGHYPDGDPVTVDAAGNFVAGADAGDADVSVSHPDFSENLEIRILAVPPDWCPNGEHDGGWSQGQCS